MKIADWIYEDNLQPFLTALSWFVGYNFDPDDWAAFEFGIKNTDAETNRWFDYTFSGKEKNQIRVANSSGTGIINLEIEVPASVAPKVEAAIQIMQFFNQTRDS